METAMNFDTRKDIKKSIQDSLTRAISYPVFRDIADRLAAEGKTSGADQTESLINYTLLNARRLKRWDKTAKISENEAKFIKNWDQPIIWLVLTESWCGDAAPILPVMHKIAELNENIDLQILFRDENLELMDLFLTDQARSIPKLIMLDAASLEVMGQWGPRPSIATKMVKEYKAIHGKLSPEFKQDLQLWYNKDKARNTLRDLLGLLTLEEVGNGPFLG